MYTCYFGYRCKEGDGFMEIYSNLGYLLNTSARLIKRKMDKQLENYRITTAQWVVLKLLDSKDKLTQAEIAELLIADRATVGAVIDKLIQKEYLDKELNPEDRRSYIVFLTKKSRKIIRKIEEKEKKVILEALEGFNQDETRVLFDVLNRIINNLSKG